jgi:hypothetical protein
MKNKTGLDKKAIRAAIVRQLKSSYPNFSRLSRKEKKRVVREACSAAQRELEGGTLALPALSGAERLGLEDLPAGVLTLEQMAKQVESFKTHVLRFRQPDRRRQIAAPLLRVMDDLLDDPLLNTLLAPASLTPSKRAWMPAQLLRMELLHTARFPSFSYRAFCAYVASLKRKEERAFCGLSLRQDATPHHATLSAFRRSLTFAMRVNLMVWLLHHFLRSGRIGDRVVHALDSTDLAVPVNSYPLGEVELPDGTKLRMFADLDCDCGRRRAKRDRAVRFVGYRIHTLCVVDVETGVAFPLLSLPAAANHHDLPVMEPLLALALAIGLELKVLVADEGYASAPVQERLRREHGILLVTPPEKKALRPEAVNLGTGTVFCHSACETPMRYLGFDDEDGEHVFRCDLDHADLSCPFAASCPRERGLPLDTGLFGPIPACVPGVEPLHDLRKLCERPFNLLKHVDGLEPCHLVRQPSVAAQVVFSQLVGLFKVLAGLRSVPRADAQSATVQPQQEVLPLAGVV